MQDLYTQLSDAPLVAAASLDALSAAITASIRLTGETVHIHSTLHHNEETWVQEARAPFRPYYGCAPPIEAARLSLLIADAAAQPAADAQAILREQPDDPHVWPDLLARTIGELIEQLPALFTPPVSPGGLVDWLCAPEQPWLLGTLASDLAPSGRTEAHGVRVQVIPEGIRVTARVLSWDAQGRIENIVEQEVWAGMLALNRWNEPPPEAEAAAGRVAAWHLLLCGHLAAHDEEWMLFPHDLFQMWPWALLDGDGAPFTPRRTRRSPVKRVDDQTVQIGAWTLGLRDGILLLRKKQEAGVPIVWRDGDRVCCLDGDERTAEGLLAWLAEHARPHSPALSDTLASWRWMLAPLPSWQAGAQFFADRGLLARLGAWSRYGQFLRTRQPGFQGWLERSLS